VADPDNDVAELAGQLRDIAKGPMSPELHARFGALAESVAVLGRALTSNDDDVATRTRIADELDRARASLVQTIRATGSAIPAELRARLRDASLAPLVDTLALVATWLRAPTPETTAAVERLVETLRAVPGLEAAWSDSIADAKREAELDADVQKSLDEIKAGMPKFEL
jgi:hypothetical protein